MTGLSPCQDLECVLLAHQISHPFPSKLHTLHAFPQQQPYVFHCTLVVKYCKSRELHISVAKLSKIEQLLGEEDRPPTAWNITHQLGKFSFTLVKGQFESPLPPSSLESSPAPSCCRHQSVDPSRVAQNLSWQFCSMEILQVLHALVI